MDYIKSTLIDLAINFYGNEIYLLIIIIAIFLISKVGFIRILLWLLNKIL